MNAEQTPVLVVSCDRYADLWSPFFKVFWNYWPDCPFPVYLGANFKRYDDERVKTIMVGEDVSWAAGVIRMLNSLKSDYLFLFLEDFLLKEKVDTNMILKLVEIAKQNQIGCLRMVSASHLSFPPTHAIEEYPGLGVILAGDINRVSTQVALWKTETLMKLLNPYFDPWQFEEIGTILSEEIPDQFWGTYHPVILYDQGVERGKWRPEGLKHCRNMGVAVDLTARPSLSDKDVNRTNLSEKIENECNHLKRSAVLNFRSGERIRGLKQGVSFLIKKPFSMKFWTIVFFGLIGKKAIDWLFKYYAGFRILRIEKSHKNKWKPGRNNQGILRYRDMNVPVKSKQLGQEPLSERLSSVIDLRIPGFTRNVAPGEVGQFAFHETPSEKWYQEFLDRIYQSIGKRHLPIYRMADGEFIFCVGWRQELPRAISGFAEKLSRKIKGKLRQSFKSFVSERKTVWGENYSRMNHDELMVHYVRCLKTVSEHGILALHFTRSAGRFSEEYFEPMCHWFEKNKIEITPENYTSFYFVYALFCGPDSKVLIRNRRLLLVTSADDQKKTRIREYMASLGAKTVQFLTISPNRALLERINLDEIKETVDLVLVAGGIGSVNILDQLKPLNTVCIDIGICMEIFADPFKRGRIFTVPDQPVV